MIPDRQHYHVSPGQSGQTLLSVLREWQNDLSWSAGRKLLRSRRVSVNGAMCLDEGRRVRAGDVIHVYAHSRTPQPTADDVRIEYFDEDVVVVTKPALMTTVRHREERKWSAARRNRQPTLDEVLPALLAEQLGTGPPTRGKSRRPDRGNRRRTRLPPVYPVHRLDRDTSGVMIVALNRTAERSLIEQFKAHSIDRVYRAVVHGHPQAQTISLRLIRDRGDGLRGVTTSPDAGEDAVTHIRPLANLGDYSLVECRLESGRTHQIRLHLSALGHLVCGDPLYTRRYQQSDLVDNSGAPRLALHATRLAFDHPRYHERMEFDSPIPDDLDRFIRRLRQRP